MTRERSLDLAGLATVVAVAAALRLWQLDTIPLGLHNDEAWTGLNAREVLRDGWIGPYLYPSGLGQPAGPVYFTALLFTFLPQTTFTLRLSMALFGIATVALTYGAARAMFDRTAALFAAALLTIMPWHLHLSRTGFMVGSWPCIEMAALWALFHVRRRPSPVGFAAAGVLVGLGIYTYNAYVLFLPLAAIPFLYDLASAPDRAARRRWLADGVVAALAALWAMLVMIDYAVEHDEYAWHYNGVSVVRADAWRQADWSGRVGILAARGQEWAKGLALGDRPDNGDGLGERDQPLLDPLTGVAAVVGLAMAARRWREPACGVLLAAAVVLPLGALLTINDGLYRRTFGLAPFIAIAAALPLAALWRRASAWRGAWRIALAGVIVAAVLGAAVRSIRAYFGPLQTTPAMKRVYPYQLDAAMHVVAQLPPQAAVYLYSDRWGAGFETIKWLLPDREVVDRSTEFRRSALKSTPVDLTPATGRPTAFVLLGRYLYLSDALRQRNPTAVIQEAERQGEVVYRVVVVDAASG